MSQNPAVQLSTSRQLLKYYQDPTFSPAANLLQPTEKNSKEAKRLSVEGHFHFLHHNYVNAITYYNQSMCHAVLCGDKSSLSRTFGHRAETFYKMKLFKECLRSIRLYLKYSPSKDDPLMHILKEKCKAGIKEKAIQGTFSYGLKLTYSVNPSMPFLICHLKVAKNNQFGRHLVTEIPLNVGDVIAIEEAYLAEFNPSERYIRCSFCWSDKRYKLFPCSFCTNAMFCSEKCEKDSWNMYHRYECGLSAYLNTIELSEKLALRALLTGLYIFKDFHVMKQFLEKGVTSGNSIDSALDVNFLYSDPQDRFIAYCKLFSSDNHFDNQLQATTMIRASEILKVLKTTSDLGEKIDSEELEEFLLTFLYHCCCVHLNNGYELATGRERQGRRDLERKSPTGLGVFLGLSLASHSCAPNVLRLQNDTRQYWIVSRPIKAGGQVFDNYGMCFLRHPLELRQEELQQNYGFLCQCEACAEDYPLLVDLPRLSHVPGNVLPESIGDYQDSSGLLKQLDDTATFIQRHSTDSYPCQQLVEAESQLWNVYKKVVENVPLEKRFSQFYTAERDGNVGEEVCGL